MTWIAACLGLSKKLPRVPCLYLYRQLARECLPHSWAHLITIFFYSKSPSHGPLYEVIVHISSTRFTRRRRHALSSDHFKFLFIPSIEASYFLVSCEKTLIVFSRKILYKFVLGLIFSGKWTKKTKLKEDDWIVRDI